ncbi:MAG: LAGLIDADG family homing endonuclease [Candidatus Woesearchaeota archaeon]
MLRVRKTPKICLDFTSTNFEYLELIKTLLDEYLNIKATYSIQNYVSRKTCYHLRIYKKEYIEIFFKNINSIKLYKNKKIVLKNWLSI